MKKREYLPLAMLILGLAGLALRWTLYAAAVDATGLLTAGTPLEWGIYALTVLALVLSCAASRGDGGKCLPDSVTALGQLLGAAGIGWTALRYSGQMPGVLGTLWKILGIAGALGLAVCAYCYKSGKKPCFPAQLLPCLFWVVHLVDNYRSWSGAPQLQSYLFALLGVMAMTLFTYDTAAQTVGMGRPQRKRFAALAAGYLCMAAALPGKGQSLYLLSALWALSSL